jgi:hypothetical protein
MPETVGTRLGDVAPGLELPPLQRQPGLHHWNRYAAVNDEFVDIHMDDEAGRAAGYPSAFGMGNLQWAYLHNLLESWLGEHGRVVALSAPHVRPDGEIRVVLAVWTDDQDGHRLAPGEATVIIGSPAGQERDTEVAAP